jgi:hypothetical protein
MFGSYSTFSARETIGDLSPATAHPTGSAAENRHSVQLEKSVNFLWSPRELLQSASYKDWGYRMWRVSDRCIVESGGIYDTQESME